MKNISVMILAVCLAAASRAQTTPGLQPYGKVDQADLEMKACDFEKDANAEVLIDKGTMYYGGDLKTVIIEYYKRIKIFNENGNKEADVHIQFYGGYHAEYITGIEAETINLTNGKIEITRLDKKQIFTKAIDKEVSEITFTLPNVKPGCIIEYRYKWNSLYNASIPAWDFQERIPVRYSELSTAIPDIFYFRPELRAYQPFVKNSSEVVGRVLQVSTHSVEMGGNVMSGSQQTDTYPYNVKNEVRAMANIPSLPDEPYMSSFRDNVQSLRLDLVSLKPIGGFNKELSDTWAKVGGILADDEDFGGQLKRTLDNEGDILSKARVQNSDEGKVALIFNEVKNSMKWNGVDHWYTIDGTSKAWESKTGNSAEINLILYHLLKQAGINAYPMVVSTRNHGKVSIYTTSARQFNRTVVYVPLGDGKNYVLDATGKYNMYNETPAELLNSMALYIDKSKKVFDTVYLKKELPARQIVLINAEIKPGGKMEGTAQLNSFSYNRINAVKNYKENGEKKYIEYLAAGDNNLKIPSVKFENMEVDTLPLTQNINFSLDLTGSDENYIYVNPNLFTPLKKNPFLSENRMTNIDFAYLQNYSINGVYKIPAGYKVDALPKSVSIVMPGKSVSFKRMVAEQDNEISVRYSINYSKAEYSKDDYSNIREFYKKMYELLNEQIILKKS